MLVKVKVGMPITLRLTNTTKMESVFNALSKSNVSIAKQRELNQWRILAVEPKNPPGEDWGWIHG